MCGHVGLAGALKLRDENTMKRLLMNDYFRGPDSTGIACVKDDNTEVKIAKIASNPINLFDTLRYKAAANAYNCKAFIGHNRAATKGAVNDVNAHPYQRGHITGAHNGTLTTESWDELQKVLGEKTGTDSEAIFGCIEKIGIDDTVKLLQGAWALVWHDAKEGTLNFLRNKERPFWYAYDKDFKLLLWASEHWMIRAACAASPEKDKYELFCNEQGYSFFQTTEDWHYRYSLDELKKGFEGRPKPRVKELKGKEPAPVKVYGGGNYGNFPRQTTGNVSGASTSTSTTPPKTSTVTPVLMKLDTTGAKPFGDYIDEGTFNQMARYGCSFCSRSVGYRDKGIVIFEINEQVIGSCCSSRDTNRVYASPIKMQKFAEEQKKDEKPLPMLPWHNQQQVC